MSTVFAVITVVIVVVTLHFAVISHLHANRAQRIARTGQPEPWRSKYWWWYW